MNKRNLYIGLIVLVLIIGGILVNNFKTIKPAAVQNHEPIYNNNSQIVIDIKGEVKKPGIYYLNSNSRIIDAINIAGGLTAFANIDNINLAKKIEDGMIINILKKEKEDETKISINYASIEELMKLPGIGEAKAKAIIEYRKMNGFFISLEQLKDIDGVNENTFKQIKEFICL